MRTGFGQYWYYKLAWWVFLVYFGGQSIRVVERLKFLFLIRSKSCSMELISSTRCIYLQVSVVDGKINWQVFRNRLWNKYVKLLTFNGISTVYLIPQFRVTFSCSSPVLKFWWTEWCTDKPLIWNDQYLFYVFRSRHDYFVPNKIHFNNV